MPSEDPQKNQITNIDPAVTNGGPTGVDKDPSEDPAGAPGTDNKVTQKGKKEDGDPTDPKDQPVTPEK
jgi:hypothetical protein